MTVINVLHDVKIQQKWKVSMDENLKSKFCHLHQILLSLSHSLNVYLNIWAKNKERHLCLFWAIFKQNSHSNCDIFILVRSYIFCSSLKFLSFFIYFLCFVQETTGIQWCLDCSGPCYNSKYVHKVTHFWRISFCKVLVLTASYLNGLGITWATHSFGPEKHFTARNKYLGRVSTS